MEALPTPDGRLNMLLTIAHRFSETPGKRFLDITCEINFRGPFRRDKPSPTDEVIAGGIYLNGEAWSALLLS